MPDFSKPTKPFRDWIEALKRHKNATRTPGTKKLRVGDLLAMSKNSDPFWAGAVMNLKLAKWFVKAWHDMGVASGVHLRRIHYRLVSTPGKNEEGLTYTNTERNWERFQVGSRQARALELVDATAFVDRQNPDPIPPAWASIAACDSPHVRTPLAPEFTLPSISLTSGQTEFDGVPYAAGYSPDDQHDRAYYLSLWIEKSTMNEFIEPLCEEFGIELVTLTGRASITASVQLLLRLRNLQKPGRVFYISDFDPAGDNMPVEVARTLEFYRAALTPDVQVSLDQIALTEAQANHFNLPRTPTKELDLSAKKFEKLHGRNATELDALEALHPGELEKLIRAAVRPYTDRTLPKRLEEAHDLAADAVREAWQDETEELQEDLASTRRAVDAIAGKYEARVNALQKEMQRELRPHATKLKQLEEDFAGVIDDFDVELDDRPMPEGIAPDESAWLFDSRRVYLEQLEHYKRRGRLATQRAKSKGR